MIKRTNLSDKIAVGRETNENVGANQELGSFGGQPFSSLSAYQFAIATNNVTTSSKPTDAADAADADKYGCRREDPKKRTLAKTGRFCFVAIDNMKVDCGYRSIQTVQIVQSSLTILGRPIVTNFSRPSRPSRARFFPRLIQFVVICQKKSSKLKAVKQAPYSNQPTADGHTAQR